MKPAALLQDLRELDWHQCTWLGVGGELEELRRTSVGSSSTLKVRRSSRVASRLRIERELEVRAA